MSRSRFIVLLTLSSSLFLFDSPEARAGKDDDKTSEPIERWYETEADEWKGEWFRHKGDTQGEFVAQFKTGWPRQLQQRAQLRITQQGNTVTVFRTQPEGTCRYVGQRVAIGTKSSSIKGTYSCSWASQRTFNWEATTENARPLPPPATPIPSAIVTPASEVPGSLWLENESGWAGSWVRRMVAPGSSPSATSRSTATFDATWSGPNNGRATAVLTVTLVGASTVTIDRVEPRGRCSYTGTLSTTRSSVAGEYKCSWAGSTAFAWSATIDSRLRCIDSIANWSSRPVGFSAECMCQAGDASVGQVVRGTDLYSLDSNVCRAAAHVGILSSTSTGGLRISVVEGSRHNPGSTRNGITSTDGGGSGASNLLRVQRSGAGERTDD